GNRETHPMLPIVIASLEIAGSERAIGQSRPRVRRLALPRRRHFRRADHGRSFKPYVPVPAEARPEYSARASLFRRFHMRVILSTAAAASPRPLCRAMAVVGLLAASAMATPARADLLGKQLFPSDNAWRQDISNSPVAANSAAIIAK